MTREKAIERICRDMNLSEGYGGYILRTFDRLGCGESLDIDTVKAIEQVIRNDFR